MVEELQANSERSPEVQIDLIKNAMAAEMNPTGGSAFMKKPEEYPCLTEVAATVSGLKKASFFMELVSDRNSAGEKSSRKKVAQKTPLVPLTYIQKRNQAKTARKAPTPLSKAGSGSRFVSTDITEKLGLQKMSMGSKAFQPKGVGVTPGTAKNLGKLGKQLAHARRMQRTPYLNANGSVNTKRLTKDLADGLRQAELFQDRILDHNLVKPEIYKGMGGPPGIAS